MLRLNLLWLLATCVVAQAEQGHDDLRTGWKFHLGEAPGAEQPDYADDEWRTVDVPHDWSIEGTFAETNSTGGGGGFLPAGIGWYRHQFTIPSEHTNLLAYVYFEGVMANSDVWINGFHLGTRPYGYVSFEYELTSHLKYGAGQTNLLAVRADNSRQPASRWYDGAGIYRPVRLIETTPVHFVQNGVFISTPKVSPEQAVIHVEATVTNESKAAHELALQLELIGVNGEPVQKTETKPQSTPAGGAVTVQADLIIARPHCGSWITRPFTGWSRE